MFSNKKIFGFVALVGMTFGLNSCYDPTQKATPESTTDWTGLEYAPQMYHSEPYDPMTQVTDTTAGLMYWPWDPVGGDSSDYFDIEGGHGEFFNSNYFNPHGMNMRVPAEGTIARGELPYLIAKDSIDLAQNVVPARNSAGYVYATVTADSSADFVDFSSDINECKELYLRFCSHCHGVEGQGDGKVAAPGKFVGVPKYNKGSLKDRPIGHIFHVITYGIRSMGSHASQLSQEERWKIATYVQELQKKK